MRLFAYRWFQALLLAGLWLGGGGGPARAQSAPSSSLPFETREVCWHRGDCAPAIRIHGDIPPSPTYVKQFERFVQTQAPFNRYRWVTLDSPGGSLRPALLLARYLRAQGYNTVVQPKAECSSACVYLFAGGVQRRLEPGSRLGIHAYEVRPNSSDDHAAFAQWVVREIAVTMRDMGIRPEWLMAMLSTPNAHICYVRPTCARELNLDNSLGVYRGPISASCSAGASTWLAADHNEPLRPPPLCAAVPAEQP